MRKRFKIEYEGKIYWCLADSYEQALAKVKEWHEAED